MTYAAEFVIRIAKQFAQALGEREGRAAFSQWALAKEIDGESAFELWTMATEQTREERPDPITALHLDQMNLPRNEWLVNRVVPQGSLMAISGRPGSFKSFFALWIALRASGGLPLFNIPEDSEKPFFCPQITKKTPTLFIEEENTLPLMYERLRGLNTNKEVPLYFRIDAGFKMQDETWLGALKRDIESKQIGLVIMDPFSSVMGLQDENSNAEAAKVMDLIRKELVAKGVSVIFIHHPAKGDDSGKSLRGAGDILGKCDVHIHLEKDELDKRLVTVSYEKMRLISETEVSNFKIRLSGDTSLGQGEFTHQGEAKPKVREERDEMAERILEVMEAGEPMQKSFIAEAVGAGRTDKRFMASFAELLNDGRVGTSIEKKNGHPLFVKRLRLAE